MWGAQMNRNENDLLLTASELAEKLRVSESQIRKLKLPSLVLSDRITRYDFQEVLDFMRENAQPFSEKVQSTTDKEIKKIKNLLFALDRLENEIGMEGIIDRKSVINNFFEKTYEVLEKRYRENDEKYFLSSVKRSLKESQEKLTSS